MNSSQNKNNFQQSSNGVFYNILPAFPLHANNFPDFRVQTTNSTGTNPIFTRSQTNFAHNSSQMNAQMGLFEPTKRVEYHPPNPYNQENVNGCNSKSFSSQKNQNLRVYSQNKLSTFLIKNDEMMSKIYNSSSKLNDSFGKNFGNGYLFQKELIDHNKGQTPKTWKGPNVNVNLFQTHFDPRLGKRGHSDFLNNVPNTANFPKKEFVFENGSIPNSQLNGNYVYTNYSANKMSNNFSIKNYSQLNVFLRDKEAYQNYFQKNHKYPQYQIPRKSTILKNNLKSQKLKISPVEIMSSNFLKRSPNNGNLVVNQTLQNYQNNNETSSEKFVLSSKDRRTSDDKNDDSELKLSTKNSTRIPQSVRYNGAKTSILQAREEKLANDYKAGLIKFKNKRINQKKYKIDLSRNFEEIKKFDLKNDLLIRPEPRGRLWHHQKKEFMVQCGKCECVVAKIDTARRNYFISTQSSRDIFANFQLSNISSIVNKSEAYPLENLKKILINMLLRQKIQPQMLDLNIFEIKLLHAVLVKRFKGFYLNSKIKLKKSYRKILKNFANLNCFREFLETKRVQSGPKQGLFKDIINQKNIYFDESNIEDIDKQQFTTAFLNILIENEPLKRLEEQLKFVLSRAEQSLIVEYLSKEKEQTPEQIDKSLKTNRYNVEVEFYHKYFFEFSKCHRIPIEKFYFPRNKNKLVSNSHKTINKSYMSNITLNTDYVRKMTSHIRDNLLKLEKETIRTKINNKIEKWNSFLLRKLNFEHQDKILEEFDSFISTNILDNDKFKLPWSVKQIESAINTVMDQLR
jgi:hypothetical protein